MAIVATVTGLDPTVNAVGANLVLRDDGVEVINQDFWSRYNYLDGPTVRNKKELISKMQTVIDEYKSIKDVISLPAYSAVFGQIQSALEV